MTSPVYLEDRAIAVPHVEASPPAGTEAEPDRVRRLEEEVFALRDTMSRFAELVLGELKQVRQPGQPPSGAPGAVPIPDTLPPSPGESIRRPWLLFELVRDLTTTVRMYLDPRYRVRRSTQLLVPVILGLFVVNYFFFGALPIPIVGTLLAKAGDIILAILLYKVLIREMIRYREALIQYAAWEAVRQDGPGSRILHSHADAPHTQLDTEG